MPKAVFLDRDGIVNEDFGYVHRPADFVFRKGIFALCCRASNSGFKLVIVTNQSGVARCKYTAMDVERLHDWMQKKFRAHGIEIDGIYYCPHHPDFRAPGAPAGCECRKPKPGMIYAAAKEMELDLQKSALIGDELTDILAAKSAGIPRRIWVRKKNRIKTLPDSDVATEVVSSLEDIDF